jgi:hypothetical protein
MPFHKYAPYPQVELPDRTWPDTRITGAPIWASVDLRDGNQALDPPMDPDRKRRLFDVLVNRVGLKEVEVGFPAAAEAEFEFMRNLATEELIPGDVTVMVLTQAREELIRKTFESLDGLPRRSSTSTTRPRPPSGGSSSSWIAPAFAKSLSRERSFAGSWPNNGPTRTSTSSTRPRASPRPSPTMRWKCARR